MKRLAVIAAIVSSLALGATSCAKYGECQPYFIREHSPEHPAPPGWTCGNLINVSVWLDGGIVGVSRDCYDSPIFMYDLPVECRRYVERPPEGWARRAVDRVESRQALVPGS